MPTHTLFAAASVIGKAHRQYQLPCQDRCGYRTLSNDSGIAVVCDGAGSCAYADLGAEQCLALALQHFDAYTRATATQNTLPSDAEWRKQAIDTLQHIRNDLELFAQQSELPFADLACTIIVVLYLPQGLLLAHIGDGRAAYRNEAGEWQAMMQPFHGEEANSTVFISSDIWHDTDTYIETIVVRQPVSAFCLLSDGCERASFEVNLRDEQSGKYYDPNRPYKPFFEPNIAALQELHRNQTTSKNLAQLWARFLENGNETLRTEPDDKTMILAVKIIDSI